MNEHTTVLTRPITGPSGTAGTTGAGYVHGYSAHEAQRLADQADTLSALLYAGTTYPAGSRVLEVGCGVGAQTLHLVTASPAAQLVAVDISADSLGKARGTDGSAGPECVGVLAPGRPERPPVRRRLVASGGDVKCVCAGQVRCCCAVERAAPMLRSAKSSHQHQLDSILPTSSALAS